MKKVKVVAIILCVVIVGIVGVLWLTLGNNAGKIDILNCNNRGMVTEFIKDNKLSNYTFDAQHGSFSGLPVLNKEANVEILFENDAIEQISVVWEIYNPIKVLVANGQLSKEPQETEYVHKYTKEEIDTVNLSFASLKEKLEDRFGVTLEQYDLSPAYDGASLEDNDEEFFKGSHIREYSVRDEAGTLWILRFEICGGLGQAGLLKLVDENGYEGFIPAVDLTKS